jgi:DNA invertase Pin-like site-specific DNA recombinase
VVQVSTDDLGKIADKWHKARERERALAVELYAAIVAAVDSGMSEVEAARVAGVDRMTVRRALGKL